MNYQDNPIRFLFVFVLIMMIGLPILLGSWYTIGAGERGILLTWGSPSQVASDSGLHFKVPLVQSVVKMNVQTQKYEAKASASSQDLQIVSTDVAVNYHISADSVVTIYTDIGMNYQDVVIQPAVQEIVKAITAQYTAEELITKRPDVKDKIEVNLRDALIQRHIVVESILITNFDFSQSFNEAVEAKVTAQQNALAAQNKLEQVKFEAAQTITKATADAQALSLKKQQVTPELIQLNQLDIQSKALDIEKSAIEKWNGQLPTTVAGGTIPFVNLNSK